MLQWIYVFMCLYNRMICNPLGIYPVMGLLSQVVFLVLDPWGIHTVFHNRWTNLHSYQQCKSVTVSPHHLQHLCLLIFLMIVILTAVTWYLNVVLIFISLITSDDGLFKMFFGCINVFFWKVSAHILHPLFDRVVFLVNFLKFFIDSGY